MEVREEMRADIMMTSINPFRRHQLQHQCGEGDVGAVSISVGKAMLVQSAPVWGRQCWCSQHQCGEGDVGAVSTSVGKAMLVQSAPVWGRRCWCSQHQCGEGDVSAISTSVGKAMLVQLAPVWEGDVGAASTTSAMPLALVWVHPFTSCSQRSDRTGSPSLVPDRPDPTPQPPASPTHTVTSWSVMT
jgi:hypothetical protein